MNNEPTTTTTKLFQSCVGRLSRLPVAKHPGLLFSLGVEGYRDYAFGARAGPSCDAANLMHEMAHACQFGPEAFRARSSANGFVFKVPRLWVYNRFCVEPKTNQMTQRELDTFAHQLHLMRLAGYKVTDASFTRYSAKLMSWMDDWWHIPGENDKDRAAWCAREISTRYEKLTAPEVVDKLEAWLDKTHRRLRRADSRSRRAAHPVRARFTGQGIAYPS